MKRLLWVFCVLLSALPLLFAGAEDDASTESGIEKQRGGGKEEGRQLPCEILVKHPGNGSAMAFGSDEARAMVVISLNGTRGKAVRIDVDAIEWAQLPPGAVEGVDHVADLGMWDSGIHLIEVFWIEDQDNDPRGLLATSVEILVYHSRDGRLPGESNLKDARDARDDSSGFFRCPFAFEPFASTTGWDWDWDSDSDSDSVVRVSKREDIGFGRGKWHEYRACLSVWMELHPHSSAGLYELGKLSEAHGDWNDAIALYRQAMDLGWTNMDGRLAELTQLAADDLIRDRRACTWNSSEESAELGWGLGPEEAMQSQGDVNGDGDGDGDGDACRGGQQGQRKSRDYSRHHLYLSVILVGRHDNTHFCQSLPDACMDRLRASLSVLISLLAKNGLSDDSEIILVEYNPCTGSELKEEGSCDERSEGYIGLREAFETLVEVPVGVSGPPVRIMTITEKVHLGIWNPYGFDLLEFYGKNAGARRARGRFLLFTNPDDIFSPEIIQTIAMRGLKDDTMYSTWREKVSNHIPVGRNATAASMQRFVESNRITTDFGVYLTEFPGASCMGRPQDQAEVVTKFGGLHDSAAGDFLLVSRRMMAETRGYPELPTNIYIDGTLLHTGAAHGFKQLTFKDECVIFHQPHPRSYNTNGALFGMTAYQDLAKEILAQGKLANIRPESVGDSNVEAQKILYKNDGSVDESVEARLPRHRFNGPDWGLAKTEISEVTYMPMCNT